MTPKRHDPITYRHPRTLAEAFGCVAISAFIGVSESAGLFGAIIGVGIYAAKKGGAA